MAIAYVQNSTGYEQNWGTSVACTAKDVTGGNCIVVVCGCYENFTPAVDNIADTKGNTYVLAGAYDNGTGRVEIWYAKNVGTQTGNVVTVTWSATAMYKTVVWCEYSGMHTTDPLDATYAPAGNADATTPYATTPADTTYDNELVVGGFYNYGSGLSYSSESPSVYRNSSSNYDAYADNLVGAAGSYGVSVAGTGDQGHVCIARAFRSSSSSTPSASPSTSISLSPSSSPSPSASISNTQSSSPSASGAGPEIVPIVMSLSRRMRA